MKLSKQLAHTLMTRYPDPDQFPYRNWCYSQAFMLWGFVRLYEQTQDAQYAEYAMRYARQHTTESGDVVGFTGSSMDDMMAGSLLVWAYQHTGEDKYRQACRRIRAAFDDYPRTPDGAFWHSRRLVEQFWVDGVFMGQMFLTKYGHVVDDGAYCFDEAARQLIRVFEDCRKPGTGLLYHAWSADRKAPWANPETGLSPEIWSEGLGWVALMLAEALPLFSPEHPERERLLMQYRLLLDDLKAVQDADGGLWYQVVDKPDRPDNWCDTSGSAMFAYAILRAVQMGIVPEGEFMPCVQKAYEGLRTKVTTDAQGLMDIHDACDGLCVQVDYAHYVDYPRMVNAKEAVAACLWFFVAYESMMEKE